MDEIVNPSRAPHLKSTRSKTETKFKCVICNQNYTKFGSVLDCNRWHRGTL